jgi:hypothetical protein
MQSRAVSRDRSSPCCCWCYCCRLRHRLAIFDWLLRVIVTLRLTVNQSWCRARSGTHDQIFSPTWWLLWSLFSWDALSDERVGLSFVWWLLRWNCRYIYTVLSCLWLANSRLHGERTAIGTGWRCRSLVQHAVDNSHISNLVMSLRRAWH